ncbi:MAG: hypothetical protein WA395_02605 [Nitrososphaeraceae archaeon]|jgi:hypothetical protein
MDLFIFWQDEINNNKFVVIVIMMSGFTFLRFRSKNMPNVEEDQRKDEIIKLIESPETKDIEFNSRISRISGEQLRDILQGNHEEMVVL